MCCPMLDQASGVCCYILGGQSAAEGRDGLEVPVDWGTEHGRQPGGSGGFLYGDKEKAFLLFVSLFSSRYPCVSLYRKGCSDHEECLRGRSFRQPKSWDLGLCTRRLGAQGLGFSRAGDKTNLLGGV